MIPTLSPSTLIASVSTSSSTTSTSASTSASCSDEAYSVLTHPSLSSLHSLLPHLDPLPPVSASFLYLSTLSPSSASAATPPLAISATSLCLYSATQSRLSVYDLSTLRLVESLPFPSGAGATKSLALSSDDSTLFTAHQDGRIRVYRRSPRSGLHRFLNSLPTTTDILLRLPNPKNQVTIRRHCKRLWIQHADAVSSLASCGSGHLYSVSWDKTLKIWSISGLRCLESVPAHDDAVNAVTVAHDGTVYTGSADRKIRVWAKRAGEKRHQIVVTLERHRSAVNALALNGDGSVLYSGACDRSILVWEREDSAEYMVVTGALRGHDGAILSLACAGNVVVSGSGDLAIRVWRRAAEGRGYSCLAVMEGHARGIRSLVVVRFPVAGANDEEEEQYRVCSGSLDGEIRVWQVCVSPVTCFVNSNTATKTFL
ncbi:hypothetical protein HPP92_024529 [Vanilla planifolia]|uniref:Uncharacterized protein n=1 Tax=Vanilla planifolia TaxID=51239 RepID=A0A835PPF7_VANPL|nr:hypothetical protein HPP92_024529 [Vanilla planifolia]